jgi:transcriptional antiterminator NusG
LSEENPHDPAPFEAPRTPDEPVASPEPAATAEASSESAPHEPTPPDSTSPPSERPEPETAAPEVAAAPAVEKKESAEKRWYIVHTYSGHEQKAKQGLLERAKALHKEDAFDEILIPEEQVVEVVKGEKRTSKRKFFPGYILVRMALNDETWHIVRGTARITGFVGGAGNKPTPISDDEVARMTQQIKEGAVKPKPKIKFEEGENVRVTSGPFANFQGFVDEVRPDKEKVRVMVQVFGRATPVELDYTQLEKA